MRFAFSAILSSHQTGQQGVLFSLILHVRVEMTSSQQPILPAEDAETETVPGAVRHQRSFCVLICNPSMKPRLRSHACAARLPSIQDASSHQPAAAREQTEAVKERKRRNNNPGVRVQGGRIYCSDTGTTCHQVASFTPTKQCRAAGCSSALA